MDASLARGVRRTQARQSFPEYRDFAKVLMAAKKELVDQVFLGRRLTPAMIAKAAEKFSRTLARQYTGPYWTLLQDRTTVGRGREHRTCALLHPSPNVECSSFSLMVTGIEWHKRAVYQYSRTLPLLFTRHAVDRYFQRHHREPVPTDGTLVERSARALYSEMTPAIEFIEPLRQLAHLSPRNNFILPFADGGAVFVTMNRAIDHCIMNYCHVVKRRHSFDVDNDTIWENGEYRDYFVATTVLGHRHLDDDQHECVRRLCAWRLQHRPALRRAIELMFAYPEERSGELDRIPGFATARDDLADIIRSASWQRAVDEQARLLEIAVRNGFYGAGSNDGFDDDDDFDDGFASDGFASDGLPENGFEATAIHSAPTAPTAGGNDPDGAFDGLLLDTRSEPSPQDEMLASKIEPATATAVASNERDGVSCCLA